MFENEHYLKLKGDLHKQVCECGSTQIHIDKWDMFDGLRDWFYVCLECGGGWSHKDNPKDLKLKQY